MPQSSSRAEVTPPTGHHNPT
ncbi:hypothetical protein FAIPA1_40194 [Frankia sp. AiPs1]